MIAVFVLLWGVAAIVLAARGHRTAWLSALLAFPVAAGLILFMDPSLRGDSAAYRNVGAVLAAIVWVTTALASSAAWFIGKRSRSPDGR